MNAVEMLKGSTTGLSVATRERALLWAYAATIGLSAFLLFAVQPLFARLVLPKLGGAPAVWAVSMCFFQAVLLAGYCYAHLLNRFLTPPRAVLVHLGVLAIAFAALPVALPAAAAAPPEGSAYLWLIGILAAGVGLPFFAISANAPLLQSWFGRTGHPHAKDPYFLYGASNLGSLAALLLYPVLAEPLFGLAMQATLWTGGFLMLATAILGCGALMLTRGMEDVSAHARAAEHANGEAPALQQRLRWIALSFVPSGLLVAFTTHLTTDIASAPFLWVVPLALFLATFIVVFRDPPLVPVRALSMALPFIAAVAFLNLLIGRALLPFWAAGLVGFVTFLAISLACHRALYEQRPAAGRLTEFYLLMSLGGVLGGIFSAILAPHLFTSIFEFPLLIAAGLFVQPRLMSLRRWQRQGKLVAGIAAAGLAVLLAADVLVAQGVFPSGRMISFFVMLLALAGITLVRRRPLLQAALLLVMMAATVLPSDGGGVRHAERNFFGVLRVEDSATGDMRILMHGTTIHGAQRLLDDTGHPVTTPVPAIYYNPTGPMARSLALVEGPRRVGIVGLGAGSMACYAKASDTWRLFEIDPAVVTIARDPAHFTFLSRCLPQAPVIVGDARLTLASEPAQGFDFLLIDAFSSDSIPVHLMTTEALQLYMSKLAPGGVLALHITNRHLDLAPVLAASAASLPGVEGVLVRNRQDTPTLDVAGSVVVMLTRNPAALKRALAWPDAVPLAASGVAAWTDDYADILSALRRGGASNAIR